MLLLGDFDGLEVISHKHSYNQEVDIIAIERNVAGLFRELNMVVHACNPSTQG